MLKVATHAEVLSRFGHALSDPTRSRIVLALREGPGYPAELSELLDVSRTNMSNHLDCLRGCDLVTAVRDGRRTRYELAEPSIGHALAHRRTSRRTRGCVRLRSRMRLLQPR
ncbi:metalloregulator ArsR/SmtB family transcription factor [Actinopolymorpha sp. NPDC004070]|uniref:ArsR/SmtB family transcription factor n=1 Tax=Actinopolymorpha sp. NPDC004070 TaxID=3154548 RepID=UPI0033B42298